MLVAAAKVSCNPTHSKTSVIIAEKKEKLLVTKPLEVDLEK